MRTAFSLRHFIALALFLSWPSIANCQESWTEIKELLFADKTILPANERIHLEAPKRPEDQSAVPIAATIDLGQKKTIKHVTFIIDENPSPVAANFTIGGERTNIVLKSNFRLNAATHVRVLVEDDSGAIYMAERFVKFAGGQAACAAPPSGDPQLIAANMGKIDFLPLSKAKASSEIQPKARVKVSHPNHTGMVLDQLTLLHIPLKIVSDIEVRQGEDLVFKLEGSMNFSQDPEIAFDYKTNGATKMNVSVKDSDGSSWQRQIPIGAGS